MALPLTLRHLVLDLASWEGPEMPGLVQNVATLTRLTALSLSAERPAHGWTTDGRANATWRAASFLTGLTRLVHLDLDHFLHANNVEGDVECLAVLTRLRSLCLHGSCACHGGQELFFYVKLQDWSVNNCEFEAFAGGFLRLLPLVGVKALEASGPWDVLKKSTFRADIYRSVDDVRRVAGRPPLKFDYLSKHGTGSRMNDDDIEYF